MNILWPKALVPSSAVPVAWVATRLIVTTVCDEIRTTQACLVHDVLLQNTSRAKEALAPLKQQYETLANQNSSML